MIRLILAVLIVGTSTDVKGSPWVFQEIKPLSESDNVKKSTIVEKPVKEIDPTKSYITIKEDIQNDIIGGNGTNSKYKEGVQKLLDFLEAGPMVNGSSKDHKPRNSTTVSKTTTTQVDQNQNKDTHKSFHESVTNILLQLNKSLASNTLSSKATQVQVTPSPPIGSNLNALKNDALKTSLSSNFMLQQSRPPAIPVRDQISYGIPNDIARISSLQQQQKVYTKSQITLGSQNGISKSHIPYPQVPLRPMYNPHTAYLKTSVPYQYGWYNTNGYKPAPNAIATQQNMQYAYTKSPVMPIRRNPLASVPKSTIPHPLYRSYPYAHKFHPFYAKSYISNHNTGLYRLPASFKHPMYFPRSPIMRPRPFRTQSNIRAPVFQRSQITHPMTYRRPVQWNLLTRRVPHRSMRNTAKYRRMAITDRVRNVNELQTSHGKITQETPLPLPLASIMTAARIVVPARPNTLNGALKSNVETIVPDGVEQKGARAV